MISHITVPFAPALLIFSFFVALTGCGGPGGSNSSNMGTYQMGQRVQVGPLTYNVLEAEWKSVLGEGASGKVPKHRFLVMRVSITNGGATNVGVPIFQVENPNGQTFPEETEGMEHTEQWLGLIRNMAPNQNDQGEIVFDVPMGAYKLRVTDGGEIGQEKTALIEVPVTLQ
jgi:hypothetical protein